VAGWPGSICVTNEVVGSPSKASAPSCELLVLNTPTGLICSTISGGVVLGGVVLGGVVLGGVVLGGVVLGGVVLGGVVLGGVVLGGEHVWPFLPAVPPVPR
jgi:hypothetical protein